MLYILFIVLTVIVAILMIGVVLIQKSKGGGLASQFSGGNQVFGVRGANTLVEKVTWTLAALILVLSVAAAYAMPKPVTADTVRADVKNVAAPVVPAANQFATDVKDAAAPAAAPAAAAPAADATAPAAEETK